MQTASACDSASGQKTQSVGLELLDVTCRFGDVAALKDVSFTAKPAEFMSIIGPSGCGKSTLLRSIAGLERIDDGGIHVGGKDVHALRPSEREVAFVFQSYALYPHMTCRQNIAAPLVMTELSALGRTPLLHRLSPKARHTRARIASRVDKIADQLQIGPMLDRRPGQLSGGQRQRVALGRALIREPKLFLLDEPLANLDAALRNTTRAELHALQRRVGATTLFVTHDQAEAMAISDRIVVMFDGQVRQIGTPDDLYRNPADIDVARFLSQPWLNCIHMDTAAHHLEAGPGRPTARVRGLPLREQTGVVAFRAEHASVHPESDRAEPALRVTVDRAEHAGSDANLFVTLQGSDTQLVVRIPSSDIPRWPGGTPANLRIDTEAAWIFPVPEQTADTDRDAMKVA
ncbi:ABC transporter ATP-binding protein [uncultured Marivita sp.]|uniref:ABC transporter ATP-binding protein n=1 Tax=uncultured Marivita sp. TaxID=888080 RepID=UPI00261849F8|nr:ABC transporter ATP-binding protein [uncultured Marivita sp.]